MSTANLTKSQKIRVNILICAVSFLLGLAIDLYVPSLPSILKYYHTQETLVEYSIGLYILGSSIGQLLFGVLSDCYGRKPILIYCSLAYTVVSLFTIVLTPNIYFFDTWRIIQGFSIAGIASTSRAMCVDTYRGKDLYKYMNYFGMFWSLGPILGPFIGGYLQHYFNWKANFVLFTVYGAIILLISAINLPETIQQRSEKNIKANLNNLKSILQNKLFVCCIITGGLCYSILVLFNTLGPFIVQTLFGFSAVKYGYVALILGFCYFLGSFSNRLCVNKFSSWTLIYFGVTVSFIACLVLFLLNQFYVNVYYILVPVAVTMYATGFVFPNNMGKAMSLFTNLAGTASSLYGTVVGLLVALISYIVSNLGTHFIMILSISYVVVIFGSLCFSVVGKFTEKNIDN